MPIGDLTITPANVLAGAGATIDKSYNAGASLTAGQSLYLDEAVTPPLWKLTDCNGAAAINMSVTTVRPGIALHAAGIGQPVAVLTAGLITIGATVTVGTPYVISATAGGIAPVADMVTGWVVSVIGVATTAAIINVRYNLSGVAVP